jgi:branched-chain amino acid aminotransferase
MTTSSDLREDRGFLLGDGLFETVRLYGGLPFRLAAHLRRLHESTTRIRFPFPHELEEAVARALRAAGRIGDGVLRVTLTRGPGHGLLPPEPPAPPTLHVHVRPFHADPRLAREGLSASLRGRVDEGALTAGIKGIGYLERITALLAAREDGASEALLRNGRGRVVSGSASNLFLVHGGKLRTPAVAEGALPGITRGVVLELADDMGIPVEQCAPVPGELQAADEILLTSSLRELVPVVRLVGTEGREGTTDGLGPTDAGMDVRVGTGRPGPVFQALLEAFRTRVAAELEAQG